MICQIDLQNEHKYSFSDHLAIFALSKTFAQHTIVKYHYPAVLFKTRRAGCQLNAVDVTVT